jgi:DNA repair photolyase
MSKRLPLRGRGASWNPPNRFETLHLERDAWVEGEDPEPRTTFLRDATRDPVSRNTSPDVPLDAGVNPYRGCEHGCIYCFARPFHEFLGFSSGLDFETKILVKENAPPLLRARLAASSWTPQPLMLSGATDPYQPVERRLGITRRVLEVLADFRNPVAVITKNHLVTRDIDVLSDMARDGAAAVVLSVTTLRNDLQRVMEPRTSVPARRLDAVRALADAGIPVGVNVAPVIPGLTDHEIPTLLRAAAEAGARWAGYILLRLPHGVGPLFTAWLEQHVPDRKVKVLNRMRELAGGTAGSRCASGSGDPLYDPRWEVRQRGSGPWARQLRDIFHVAARAAGLDTEAPTLSCRAFRRPHGPGGQGELFGG